MGYVSVSFNGNRVRLNYTSSAEQEEIYTIFTTSKHKMLLILHVDDNGVNLTKRPLFQENFTPLADTSETITLTRKQLKGLVLDATYVYEWQNTQLKDQMEALMQAELMPKTTVSDSKSDI